MSLYNRYQGTPIGEVEFFKFYTPPYIYGTVSICCIIMSHPSDTYDRAQARFLQYVLRVRRGFKMIVCQGSHSYWGKPPTPPRAVGAGGETDITPTRATPGAGTHSRGYAAL